MHSEREFDIMNIEAEMFVLKMLEQFDADYYGKRQKTDSRPESQPEVNTNATPAPVYG